MKSRFTRHPFLTLLIGLLVILAVIRIGSYIAFYEVNRNAVDPQQASAMLKNPDALLLDVRRPEEYRQGHAPGARLIPLGQLSERLAELQDYRKKPVVVMCRTGGRSAFASRTLMGAGFTQVHNLEGGIHAWQQAGLPVER